MDAANIDLKAFSEGFYKHICGAQLGAVLDTLEYLRTETAVWLEITNLLVPDANDSDAEIDAMTSWVVGHLGADVPLHFTAFHPDFKMTDRPRTPAGALSRARRIALANGVRHAYTGNVHDTEGSSTYCSGCGTRLVERDRFQVGEYRLTGDGHCQNCGTRCSGVYDGPAGTWGARCRPVRISEALGGD
jgi:pyruvate formate lyase activating enzyme